MQVGGSGRVSCTNKAGTRLRSWSRSTGEFPSGFSGKECAFLSIDQSPSFGLRDGIAEFLRSIDPEVYGFLRIRECVLWGVAVGFAAWKFGNISDEGFVVVAPENNDFVAMH